MSVENFIRASYYAFLGLSFFPRFFLSINKGRKKGGFILLLLLLLVERNIIDARF